jgi:hypothetical protein
MHVYTSFKFVSRHWFVGVIINASPLADLSSVGRAYALELEMSVVQAPNHSRFICSENWGGGHATSIVPCVPSKILTI